MRLHTRQHLARLSRDRSFLLRAGFVIMAVACAIGWLVSMFTSAQGMQAMLVSAEGDAGKLGEMLGESQDLNAEQAADWIRKADQVMLKMALQRSRNAPLDGRGINSGGDKKALSLQAPLPMLEKIISEASKVDASERMLLLNFARALYGEDEERNKATENLHQATAMEPAVRFANEFYADVLMKSEKGNRDKALKHYLREADLFEQAAYARQHVVRILLLNEDRPGLKKISADSKYIADLDAHSQMRIATVLRDWPGLAKAVLKFDYDRSSLGRYLISLFAGAIWLIIIGQFAGFEKRRLILYALALVLGVMSASATLFTVVVQEQIRGFTMEGDLMHQLIYCVAGIGLREEVLKLLFFIPLIPLLKKRPQIDALVVAAIVGLGFAIQENVGYYQGGGFSPWARFFTANFFHMAVTGLLGLALVQFVRWPRTRWEELLSTFIAAVVLHGLYDAFYMIPQLLEFSSFAPLLILSVIAYRFFDIGEHLASSSRRRDLSPLGVFVLGAALLAGVLMIVSCWGMPFRLALMGFLGSGLSIFPIIFIFINRFRDA